MKKYFQELIKNPLVSGSAVMILGSNSVSFINYVYHFILARMLGPSGYGELAALISLIGLLGIIPTSFSLVIIKYISSAKNEESLNGLIKWLKSKVLRISILFFLLIIFISPFISSFLKINNIYYFILIAVSFLFSLRSVLNRSILQGLLRFKVLTLSILIENMGKLLISVTLVFLGYYVGGATMGFAIASFFGLYISSYFLKDHDKNVKLHLHPDVKAMIGFTIPVLIQSLATTSIYSSDIILVKHFFQPHDAGIYAALSTLGKIIFFGAGPIGAVMFPLVSRRHASGKDYQRIFVYSFFATIIFSLIILSIYWIVPNIAINLLYGSIYLEASKMLVWFGIFMTFFTLASLLINYSLSVGETGIVIYPLIAAVIQILIIWIYHNSIYQVVFNSSIITALLVGVLLIYLSVKRRLILWK